MLVTARRSFKLYGKQYERGQELDIEDTRLASRLVRAHRVTAPDQTNVKTKLVVTHRPRKTIEAVDEIVMDERGNPVVSYVVMEGALGKPTPRLLTPAEAEEIKLPFGTERTRDMNNNLMFKLVRYRTRRRTTTKRGLEWNGKWLDPGDEFPGGCSHKKIYNLKACGWIKEVPVEDEPAKKPRGRPKGSKNKKKRKRSQPQRSAA